jgi:DNA-binding NarL/FixJ family response regulator
VLQESRQLLPSVFEAMPSAILVYKALRDEAGRIEDFEWLLAEVAEGEEYFSTDLTKLLLQKMQAAAPTPAVPGGNAQPLRPPVPLSPRELEVLRLIAKGHTNHHIAAILFTSRRTVESHRHSLLEKTGTNNTTTLILYAASNGLLV